MVVEAAAQAERKRGWGARLAVLALPLGLAGCGSPDIGSPVDWWHGLEGGVIADQRPPPPGAEDPFGNLGQIPKRPTPTNPATRQDIANALSADRTLAEQQAALVPIAPVAATQASPGAAPESTGPGGATLGGGPTPGATGAATGTPGAPSTPAGMQAQAAKPGDQPASGITASLDAASAPPPAPAPPQPGAPAPPPPAGLLAADGPSPAGQAGPQPVPVAGPLPPLPGQPPVAPEFPGIAVPVLPPPATTIRPPPPTAPPLPTGPGVLAVTFAPGSAILPPGALPGLRAFTAGRGRRAVSVVGRGEAASSDADMQSAALDLGLERAQAIAAALSANGLPQSAIRLGAEAAGRGAYLRLVD